MAKKGGASTEKKASDKKSGGKNAGATKTDESADKKVNIFQESGSRTPDSCGEDSCMYSLDACHRGRVAL